MQNNFLLGMMLPIALTGGFVTTAVAREVFVELTVAAEGFEEPPVVSVSQDGAVFGSGIIDNALMTPGPERLTAGNVADHLKTFSFRLPAATNGPLEIRLTNDVPGREDEGIHTNLFIAALRIDGEDIPVRDIDVRRRDEPQNLALRFDMLPLFANSYVAVVPLPEATAADAVVADCPELETVVIGGFASNSASVPDAAQALLDALVAQMLKSDCAVTAIGYSSVTGPQGYNQRLSAARADAVAAYATSAGVEKDRFVVEAGGPTEAFGQGASANQIVVITQR